MILATQCLPYISCCRQTAQKECHVESAARQSIFPPSVTKVYLCYSPFSLCVTSTNQLGRSHATCLHCDGPHPTIYYPAPSPPAIYYKTIEKLSSRGHLLPPPPLKSHQTPCNGIQPNILPHTSSNDSSLSQFRDLLFPQPQLLRQNLHYTYKISATLI